MRVAVLHEDRCQPKKCQNECYNFCPPVRNGIEVITWRKDNKPIVSEPLCIGCGICVHKCPHDALTIVNLPDEQEKETIHRYGMNEFRLFGLPAPEEGNVIGILGANGTGKTTAISLLAGEIIPNLGEWEEDGNWDNVIDYYAGTDIQKHFIGLSDEKIRIALKPQYVDKIPKMFDGTLRELLEKVTSPEKVNEFAEKINLTSLDKNLSKVSGGELQKGAIAATLLKDADLYFFDEPSSYLDIEQRILMAKMISELGEKKSVIVIEHDLAILDYVTNNIYVMYGSPNAYGIVSQKLAVRNAINSYLDGYIQESNVRIRDNTIKFLKHPPRTGWDGIGLIKWPKLSKKLGDFKLKAKPGEILSGQVLGVVGGNATGKTTFVKMLAGILEPDEGEIESEITVSYKPQYIEVQDDIIVGDLLQSVEGFDEHILHTELNTPLNLEPLMERELKTLSGGELQRVAVAECLLREADLYLLDEPSAYLDANQRMVTAKTIRRSMEQRGKSALVVDHDVYFIDYIADGLLCFGGIPSKEGNAEGPYNMRKGMNIFLERVGVTFRRDKNTNRPRINKPESRLDREQKSKKEYYYSN
ncbi:MAG TPA: ribosome biogenesis/translation initiation ATPase RLI [Marine Group III euryarchaeote]|jgi:ATP-binding cassette subfamily E protein 1|uniref:Ribosome biogenesis/translation initiation ATPase RLI n=1 Tax=Marine Group III euryarchaeote TaxID=2173149 RepID=A0A7J4GSH8_9ARCH|nr:ribosome biogenesis/translation initiation ATPase RLI [Marine Group III euryarchaeote]